MLELANRQAGCLNVLQILLAQIAKPGMKAHQKKQDGDEQQTRHKKFNVVSVLRHRMEELIQRDGFEHDAAPNQPESHREIFLGRIPELLLIDPSAVGFVDRSHLGHDRSFKGSMSRLCNLKVSQKQSLKFTQAAGLTPLIIGSPFGRLCRRPFLPTAQGCILDNPTPFDQFDHRCAQDFGVTTS
jgi:hypothetical protein